MSDPKPTPSFPPPGFTRFWWGEAVSSFGTYVTLLALQTVVVLTMDGTAQDVGWLNSARWLPEERCSGAWRRGLKQQHSQETTKPTGVLTTLPGVAGGDALRGRI